MPTLRQSKGITLGDVGGWLWGEGSYAGGAGSITGDIANWLGGPGSFFGNIAPAETPEEEEPALVVEPVVDEVDEIPAVDEIPLGDKPVFDPPTYVSPDVPEFEYDPYAAPTRDVGRIEELRTKAAGPGVRRAIQAMQRALMQEYRNPNLARLAMRDILAGHGEALSGIYGGAAQTAEGQYGIEFAGKQTAARMEYEAGFSEASQEYQAGWSAKLTKAMADWQAEVEAAKRDYEWELMQGGWM